MLLFEEHSVWQHFSRSDGYRTPYFQDTREIACSKNSRKTTSTSTRRRRAWVLGTRLTWSAAIWQVLVNNPEQISAYSHLILDEAWFCTFFCCQFGFCNWLYTGILTLSVCLTLSRVCANSSTPRKMTLRIHYNKVAMTESQIDDHRTIP